MASELTVTTSSGSQSFVWNNVAKSPQVIMDSNNAYIYGTGLTPSEQVSLSSGTITYLVSDICGSVRGAVTVPAHSPAPPATIRWGNPRLTGGLTAITPFGYAGGQ